MFNKYFFFVLEDGMNIVDVPKDFRDEELCIEAMKHIPAYQFGTLINYVPEKIRANICLEFMKSSKGYCLMHIPEKYRNEDICAIAVKKNGVMLEHVPEKLLQYDMVCDAIVSRPKEYARRMGIILSDDYLAQIPLPLCREIKALRRESTYEDLTSPEKIQADPTKAAGIILKIFRVKPALGSLVACLEEDADIEDFLEFSARNGRR